MTSKDCTLGTDIDILPSLFLSDGSNEVISGEYSDSTEKSSENHELQKLMEKT